MLLLDETVRSIPGAAAPRRVNLMWKERPASTDQIDADKLHYLMARGLSKEQATQLMVEAAFQPVLDRLPREWRGLVRRELEWRLNQCPSW